MTFIIPELTALVIPGCPSVIPAKAGIHSNQFSMPVIPGYASVIPKHQKLSRRLSTASGIKIGTEFIEFLLFDSLPDVAHQRLIVV